MPGRLRYSRCCDIHYLWLTLVLIASHSGCSGSRTAPLPVYAVKGELFVGDKPAEAAVVAFHPRNRSEWASATSRGVVDRDGRFSLTTYAANDGAPEGEYVVTVYWPERALDPAGEGNDLPKDKLDRRFAKSADSKLRARIGPQPITFARVDLGDKAVSTGKEFYFVEQGL